MLRHGGRTLNVSQLVAAGRLVVVAQADGPVPFPLKVDGGPVGGEGVTIYEVVAAAAGQAGRARDAAGDAPTTGPATGPSGAVPVATAAVGAVVPGR